MPSDHHVMISRNDNTISCFILLQCIVVSFKYTIVLLRDVFHIGLVIGPRPIHQTEDLYLGQYEKHHVMIPLLINQSNISRHFSFRVSKRLADSDLAVIGLTGIGPIRKISVLDWFLPYWPNESFKPNYCEQLYLTCNCTSSK